MLTAMVEPERPLEAAPQRTGCPLKRVKLSHTIPLCIFVMCNMWLVVGALLGISIARLSEMGWNGIGGLRDEYHGKKEVSAVETHKEEAFAYKLREDY